MHRNKSAFKLHLMHRDQCNLDQTVRCKSSDSAAVMRAVFVFVLFAITVLPGRGKPAVGNTTEGETNQDQLCGDFGRHFIKTSKPQVPVEACSHDISVYRALNAAQSPCLQGYARHSNGRCYRVVDKQQNGQNEPSGEYRITYRAVCSQQWEMQASELQDSQRLDFCDEDGGCLEVIKLDGEEERTVADNKICVDGHKLDASGICRRLLVLSHSKRSVEDASTETVPDVCVEGRKMDADGVCREVVEVGSRPKIGFTSGSVPDRCSTGYVKDTNGVCRRLLEHSQSKRGVPDSSKELASSDCVEGRKKDANGVCRKIVGVESRPKKEFSSGSVLDGCSTGYVKDTNGVCKRLLSKRGVPDSSKELASSDCVQGRKKDTNGVCRKIVEVESRPKKEFSSGSVLDGCGTGYVKDTNGVCKRLLSKRSVVDSSTERVATSVAPDVCVGGRKKDANGVCRTVVNLGSRPKLSFTTGGVPDGCRTGYIQDSNGVCRRVVGS